MILPKGILLLDIETSGLSRTNDHIISIGMTYQNDLGQVITQYDFLDDPNQEACLLQRFIELLPLFHTLLCYYGKGFEFPFILSRLEYLKLDTSLFLKQKLIDMKKVLKQFSNQRATLENCFHYKRQCTTTGYDVAKLSRTYCKSPLPIYKTCILAHQKEEMESLLLFWELYQTLSWAPKWCLNYLQVTSDQLHAFFYIQNGTFSHNFSGITSSGLHLEYTKDTQDVQLTFPLYHGILEHTLQPIKDYYYVETQHQLMHKTLAQFIPASHKRKATPTECTIQKESTFVPIYRKESSLPSLWYDENKHLYIELQDLNASILQSQIFYLFFQSA